MRVGQADIQEAEAAWHMNSSLYSRTNIGALSLKYCNRWLGGGGFQTSGFSPPCLPGHASPIG